MYTPTEEQIERLCSDDVTYDEVCAYLWAQHDARIGESPTTPLPPLAFFDQESLDSYGQARAWWPTAKDLPHSLACPTVYQLCFSYWEGPTFLERLTKLSMPVVTWMAENGYDIAKPQESPKDRKVRMNTEAQRRYRARKEGGEGAAHAQAVADAYAAYLQACADRKAAYDALTPMVNVTYDAWAALKQNPPTGEG